MKSRANVIINEHMIDELCNFCGPFLGSIGMGDYITDANRSTWLSDLYKENIYNPQMADHNATMLLVQMAGSILEGEKKDRYKLTEEDIKAIAAPLETTGDSFDNASHLQPKNLKNLRELAEAEAKKLGSFALYAAGAIKLAPGSSAAPGVNEYEQFMKDYLMQAPNDDSEKTQKLLAAKQNLLVAIYRASIKSYLRDPRNTAGLQKLAKNLDQEIEGLIARQQAGKSAVKESRISMTKPIGITLSRAKAAPMPTNVIGSASKDKFNENKEGLKETNKVNKLTKFKSMDAVKNRNSDLNTTRDSLTKHSIFPLKSSTRLSIGSPPKRKPTPSY